MKPAHVAGARFKQTVEGLEVDVVSIAFPHRSHTDIFGMIPNTSAWGANLFSKS